MTEHLARGLALGLMVCAPVAAAAQGGDWKEYVYPADGFAISAPKQPTVKTETVGNAPGGPVEAHSYTIDIGDDTVFMVIANNRHPNDPRTAHQALIEAKNGAVRSAYAKIDTETPVSFGSDPGIDIRFTAEKYHGEARYYLINRTLYQLYSISPVSMPLPAGTDRFYQSFRLIPSSTKAK